MDNTKMMRSNVAKKLHINPETLRYYEQQKLIKNPKRLENNYRIYDKEDISRIQFILMAKQLGFTLKEIKELLKLSITEKSDRKKVQILIAHKSKLIYEKLKQLTKLKKTLDDLLNICQTNETATDCPILKSLYQE